MRTGAERSDKRGGLVSGAELLAQLQERLSALLPADGAQATETMHQVQDLVKAMPSAGLSVRPEELLLLTTDRAYRQRIIETRPQFHLASLLAVWQARDPQTLAAETMVLTRVLAVWVDERAETAATYAAAPTDQTNLADRMYAPRRGE